MKTKSLHSVRAASLGALPVVAVALLAGCTSGPSSRVLSAPPPGTAPATTQTVVVPANTSPPVAVATTTPASTIIVQQAPPAVQQENAPTRPSSRHAWVGGYWAWSNSRYEWIPGRWLVPPREGARWIPSRWEPEGNGYRFYDGYWD